MFSTIPIFTAQDTGSVEYMYVRLKAVMFFAACIPARTHITRVSNASESGVSNMPPNLDRKNMFGVEF